MYKITNANGKEIPQIGLGTFPLQGRAMADMLVEAAKIGYRLIDTADDYRGETGIGIGCDELKDKVGLSRADMFLQTKISQDNAHQDEPLEGIWFGEYSAYQKRHTVDEIVRDKVEISLREMHTDYIDSILIHYPFPGYYEEIWNTMINLKKEGKVRYIGVSNFHINHVEVLKKSGFSPEINEIYMSPIGTKQEDVDYSAKEKIQLITYSPLMDISGSRINKDIIVPIAERYQKSIAQIILRWNVQRGCIPLPRTKNYNRLKENFNVFDFKITKEEMYIISSMNEYFQYLPESKSCPGI